MCNFGAKMTKRMHQEYAELHKRMIGLSPEDFEHEYRRRMADDTGTDDLQDCAGTPPSGDD